MGVAWYSRGRGKVLLVMLGALLVLALHASPPASATSVCTIAYVDNVGWNQPWCLGLSGWSHLPVKREDSLLGHPYGVGVWIPLPPVVADELQEEPFHG